MSTTFYVFDNAHIKAEGLTKEQIINAIQEATGVTPQDVDTGFISTIIETNNGHSLHFWKGTKAQYEALQTHDTDTFYIISDDTTVQDLQTDYEEIESQIEGLEDTINAIIDDDTGWLDLTATNLSSETESVGRYRVKNGIAYFDISLSPSDFTTGTYIQFRLPINLDIDTSKRPTFVLASGSLSQTATFVRCYAQYEAGAGGGTNLRIDVDSTSNLVRGNFSYPVMTNN